MIRRPPRSTLFPYTDALPISGAQHGPDLGLATHEVNLRRHAKSGSLKATRAWRLERSEEHTSELQSLAYLVCRLLLEKKKNNKITWSSRNKNSSVTWQL